MTLVATENKEKYIFPCGEWLKREGDEEGEIVKELFPLRKGEKLAGPRSKSKVDEGDSNDIDLSCVGAIYVWCACMSRCVWVEACVCVCVCVWWVGGWMGWCVYVYTLAQ